MTIVLIFHIEQLTKIILLIFESHPVLAYPALCLLLVVCFFSVFNYDLSTFCDLYSYVGIKILKTRILLAH